MGSIEMSHKEVKFFDAGDGEKLAALRTICFDYLEGAKLEQIDNSSLVGAHEFLQSKYDSLIKLRKMFGSEVILDPFAEIEESMTQFTLSGTLSTNISETRNAKMNRDIDTALDKVGSTFAILQKIMEDRNMFN